MKLSLRRLYLVAILTLGTSSYVFGEDNNYIYRGDIARYSEFPWVVQIRSHFESRYTLGFVDCSGVLVHPQWVLTAAACVRDSRHRGEISEFTKAFVKFGPKVFGSASTVSGSRVRFPPGYDHTARFTRPDIALLRLNRPIPSIRSVVIGSTQTEAAYRHRRHYVVGWGKFRGDDIESGRFFSITPRPRMYTAKRLAVQKCLSMLTDYFENPVINTLEPRYEVCLYNDESPANTCQGDGGGPVLVNTGRGQTPERSRLRLVGVTSWGYNGCHESNHPTVFARVSHYKNWIRRTISNR